MCHQRRQNSIGLLPRLFRLCGSQQGFATDSETDWCLPESASEFDGFEASGYPKGAGPQKRLSALGRSKRRILEPGVTAARRWPLRAVDECNKRRWMLVLVIPLVWMFPPADASQWHFRPWVTFAAFGRSCRREVDTWLAGLEPGASRATQPARASRRRQTP